MVNYADIAILVILVLSVIIGLVKGFWRTFSKMIALVASIALGFVFATKLSSMMFSPEVLESINSTIAPLIIKNPIADGVVTAVGSEYYVILEGSDPTKLDAALKMMLIPSFLHAPIVASVTSATTGMTLGAIVSSAYTHLISLVTSGGLIFLGSFIVLSIIASLIYKAIAYRQFHKAVDRIFGGLFRIVTGLLFVAIVFQIFGMMSGFEFMAPVMSTIEEGTISGPLFRADILNKIFYGEGMQKLTDLFQNVIASAGGAPTAAAILGETL